MKTVWTEGNRVALLENGEQFFPAVFDAIRAATREVIVETFILWEDEVGTELQQALIAAAERGVSVDLMVDGFGSAQLTEEFVQAMTRAGVRVRTFDAAKRHLGLPVMWTRRLKMLRRMHRKLVVADGATAFVGGINYSADHLMSHGPMAKQDWAVRLDGPVVEPIRQFALTAIGRPQPGRPSRWRRTAIPAPPPPAQGSPASDSAQALFVTRDNIDHHNDIERHYRVALRSARERVVIANAYFFPGYRLIKELVRAARRGVDVCLVLQGQPDMPIARYAATLLYAHLLRNGVKVHEYCRRPLHGKVAVIDDIWATVGSSNLDPLSLSLNLEANVMLRDRDFARHLRERLDNLIAQDCKRIEPLPSSRWEWWESLRTSLVFHALRRFPSWAASLPRHAPTLHAPKGGAHADPAGDDSGRVLAAGER